MCIFDSIFVFGFKVTVGYISRGWRPCRGWASEDALRIHVAREKAWRIDNASDCEWQDLT